MLSFLLIYTGNSKLLMDNRKNSRVRVCVVKTCLRNNRNSSDDFPFRPFKFPNDTFCRSKWVHKLNLGADVESKFACDRPFERKYFGKKLLLAAI